MILSRRIVGLCLLLLFNTATFHAQQSFSININSRDGLPSDIVYDIFCDSKGFVWLASNSGLTRYDGFEFLTYSTADQTSLPGSAINEDKYGRIWYQNFDGYLYCVEDEQLHSISQSKPGEFVPFGLLEDYLLVVQQNGVDVFDLSTLKLLRTIPVSAKNILASTVLNNAYYFLADNKVYKLDKDFQLTTTDYFKANQINVNRLCNDGEQLFLLYKNNDEHQLHFMDANLSYKGQQRYPSKGRVITEQYLNGNYWLYTNDGCFVYDKKGNLALSKSDLPIDDILNKCAIDKRGNYLFSGLSNGFYLIPDFNHKVYSNAQYSLRNMVKHPAGYLASTIGGDVILMNEQFNYKNTFVAFGEKHSIINIDYNAEDDLLFTSTSFGFFVHHKGKQVFTDDIAVKDVVKLDAKYYALAGSGFVLLLINPSLGKQEIASIWNDLYTKHKEHKDYAVVMTNLRAKTIGVNHSKNEVIVSSNTGLHRIGVSANQELMVDEKHFYASEVFPFEDKIYALDNNGNLFLIENGKSELLNHSIGIGANGIKLIKQFEDQLYIIGGSRLFQYDMDVESSYPLSFNIGSLSVSDLLKVDEKLALVSSDGIITVDLTKRTDTVDIPQFYFNGCYVSSERVSQEVLENLKPSQNNLRIAFSLLDYGGSREPQMSYRIDGKDWILLTPGAREIQLTALSSGNYKIEIKLNDTILEESILFSIDQPYYRKWWFILGFIVVILLALVVAHTWRMHLLRKKIRLLNEKIVLEGKLRTSMLTSLKAQMNPHFFYNALNTIQSYIFASDKHNATNYLAKFSKLTRMILEMSGQSTVKLDDEIQAIQLYLELEQMRFQSDFAFEINVSNQLNRHAVEIPAMLIQPYVENAVKHGLLHKAGNKQVIISFAQSGSFLEVTIDDNGVGRKRSAEINSSKFNKPKSFSTESNQTRLDLLNSDKDVVSVRFEDKYDDNQKSLGTRVTLLISTN